MSSVFSHHRTNADRSASDKRRHKQKIEKAIKDGIHNIVAEESIIGKDGKKKIRIPVKGIKEYKFIYGNNEKNSKKVGEGGDLDVKRGQKISQGKKQGKKGKGNKAGDKAGEEYYDVEITLEELADYLFTDLNLPDLQKKNLKKIISSGFKRKGYRNSGIRPRLSKKETAKRRIKRKKAAIRSGTYDESVDENFPYHDADLRYKHISKKNKYASNACIFFIMDVSGSMSTNKKYLARSFFFLLYHFIRSKYEQTEIIFIAHDTKPYEVDEDKFFKRGSGGGTIVSPTYQYVCDAIDTRYNSDSWNLYTFHCSDGDNWANDNEKAIEYMGKLKEKCQFVGYCEIVPESEKNLWLNDASLSSTFAYMQDEKMKISHIEGKDDVWPAFSNFFGVVDVI